MAIAACTLARAKRQLEALAEIQADLANVRAAWHRALSHGDGRGLNQGLGTLEIYFNMRNRYHESAQLFEQSVRSLAGAKAAERRRTWRRLTIRLGFVHAFLGVATADQVVATLALHNLAARAIHLGEYDTAEHYLLQALVERRSMTHRASLAG